jgi:hypothetical protein
MNVRAKAEWVLVGGLVLAAMLKVSIAFSDDGIYWPDEVYQTLEPAHRAVFGYGFIAWEFIDGARNWALPGAIAALFALGKAVGLSAPSQYIGLTRVAFVAISIGTGWAVWALARVLGAGRWASASVAVVYSLCRVSLYFSHRAMSENACTLPIVIGLWLLVDNASRRRRLLGVGLLGLSVLIRLQSGIFCVAVLVWQLARRRVRHAAESFAVLVAMMLLFGWVDHLAWSGVPGTRFGGWFHSAFKYIDFNVVKGGAAAWGTSSRDYYLHTLETALPLLGPLIVIGALLASRDALFVFVSTMSFLIVHSLVPHKELRFVLPILPLFFALAAVGFTRAPARSFRAACLAVLGVTGFVSLAGFRALTFGDIGAYAERANASAWDDYGPLNRLLEIAGAQPDLCGIRVDAPYAWTGGYTYLHREVPFYSAGQPESYYNYAIVTSAGGASVVATERGLDLVHTGERCLKNPGYSWRLP